MSFIFGNDKSKIKYNGDMASDLSALKAQVGNLKIVTKSAAGGSGSTFASAEFYFNPSTRALLVCTSANGQANGLMNVYVDNSGWVSTFPLVGMSNQQTTHAITGQLKIENRTTSLCTYTLLVFAGDAD